jgi:hypothetical protein
LSKYGSLSCSLLWWLGRHWPKLLKIKCWRGWTCSCRKCDVCSCWLTK